MLIAKTNGLELITALRPIVERLKQCSADLADQVERAGTSILLNIGEGSRRTGKDRVRFFRYAHGSAGEIEAALETANAWGYQIGDTRHVMKLLDLELRLLWGLQRGPRAVRSS